MILLTGGAGFIGSAFALYSIKQKKMPCITLDALTYAGNLANLDEILNNPLHTFIKGDICDAHLLHKLMQKYKPTCIVHCAAESHVDRSIKTPTPFIKSNITGTFILLEAALSYWKNLPNSEQKQFRFLHLSTDEVYGSIPPDSPPADESTAYAPNSPYAASKAASDHLVRAYHETYGLPTLTVHTSNNFGPRQFPEKLIPMTLFNLLKGRQVPIYGDGKNSRDWIYVDEHCMALDAVLQQGTQGAVYNICTGHEKTNLEVVSAIISILEEIMPAKKGDYNDLIDFVRDRPGHDRRYAMNNSKVQREIGWQPVDSFETNLRKTILWYLNNEKWTQDFYNRNDKIEIAAW